MDSFPEDSAWNLLDYSRIIEDTTPPDFFWSNQSASLDLDASSAGGFSVEKGCAERSACMELDASSAGDFPTEKRCSRKRCRGCNESCGGTGSKAFREKMRRDRMNDRFADLCFILEPGRSAKTDKSAILNDAIRVLNQLRTEAQELKEANEKLQEDIKNLKAEKNELREEKLMLKADKERMEQQVKAMSIVPTGFIPPHPAAFQAGVNKMMAFPTYGGFPMWQWIPPAALDTTQDHVLRPPVA